MNFIEPFHTYHAESEKNIRMIIRSTILSREADLWMDIYMETEPELDVFVWFSAKKSPYRAGERIFKTS